MMALDSITLATQSKAVSQSPPEPENGFTSQKSHTIGNAWRPNVPCGFSLVTSHLATDVSFSAIRSTVNAKHVCTAISKSDSNFACRSTSSTSRANVVTDSICRGENKSAHCSIPYRTILKNPRRWLRCPAGGVITWSGLSERCENSSEANRNASSSAIEPDLYRRPTSFREVTATPIKRASLAPPRRLMS